MTDQPRFLEVSGMRLVVASEPMRTLLAMVERIAQTSAPVLITGESGTGKELIARAIHHFSPRAALPFLDVNCAALPEHLMESELFGFEKGAFNGAESPKQGFFELAQEGTIFLDEICELDSRMQAKLLRILDGQPWFRLGGTSKVSVHPRVVATTNLNLDEAVQSGKFRRDLFYRLDVFELRVPPLRERLADLAPLAAMFLEGSGCALTNESLTILEDYAWPGNIRELRNVLLRASLFASGSEIRPANLPAEFLKSPALQSGAKYSLEELEQQMILRVLDQTNGHQQRAANILKISRRTLIRKLNVIRKLKAGRHDKSPGTDETDLQADHLEKGD
jgi:two-component system response regulator AtoC